MVQSKLNPTINFPEIRYIDKVDIGFKAPIYSIILFKKPIIIALGQINSNFQEQANIVYFPIYLIGNSKVILQIGLYEILNNNLPNVLDKNGDLDLTLVDSPLIYAFVKSNLSLLTNNNSDLEEDVERKLSKIEEEASEEEQQLKEQEEVFEKSKQVLKEKDEESDEGEEGEEGEESEEGEEDEESEEGEESRESEEDVKKVKTPKKVKDGDDGDDDYEEYGEELEDEQYEQALDESDKEKLDDKKLFEKEQDDFIVTKDTKWVEKYFKNNNFDRINNEGGGECLFAVIRDALETIGKKMTIKEMRIKLSQEANEEIFQNYKEKYDMFKSALDVTNDEVQELIKKNKQLKIELSSTSDRTEHKRIIKEAASVKENFERVKQELKFQKDLLEEWKFMKNIKTLESFKELIQKCDFWADTWAISTLERLLNIKLIIFSFEHYNSELLKSPKKNITTDNLNIILCGQLNDKILEERGNFEPSYYIMTDYDGIHYQLLTYKKRGAFTFKQLPYKVKELISEICLEGQGPYNIIPDIVNFKLQNVEQDVRELEGGGIIIDNDPTNTLYNDSIQLKFYNRSLDALPGKGRGEKILDKDLPILSKLASIKNWRKKLSNFWDEDELLIDGKRWKTLEHYIQGSKFKHGFPSFYNQFSLDSNTNISKNPYIARAAGSKLGKLKHRQIRPTHIVIDENYKNKLPEILNKGLYVKFIQDKNMKNLLKLTGKSKLLCYKRGNKPVVANELMKIRKLIK
jgi:predicted NAD-dependent protein-ADP-ribosyltransferase YbiA (DUF1768 family)